jgi:hypothetical protein
VPGGKHIDASSENNSATPLNITALKEPLCQNARMPKPSSRGERGRTGARGKAGPAGPAGPTVKREEILAIVDDEFAQIRTSFKNQLLQTTKIQSQLDEIHSLLKKLIEQSSYAR